MVRKVRIEFFIVLGLITFNPFLFFTRVKAHDGESDLVYAWMSLL